MVLQDRFHCTEDTKDQQSLHRARDDEPRWHISKMDWTWIIALLWIGIFAGSSCEQSWVVCQLVKSFRCKKIVFYNPFNRPTIWQCRIGMSLKVCYDRAKCCWVYHLCSQPSSFPPMAEHTHASGHQECIDFCVANANDCQGIVILRLGIYLKNHVAK